MAAKKKASAAAKKDTETNGVEKDKILDNHKTSTSDNTEKDNQGVIQIDWVYCIIVYVCKCL